MALLALGERTYFSAEAPRALRELLDQALLNRDDCERLLLRARARWPHLADAHVALYKHYFVAARYREAEVAIWQALRQAAARGGFSRNYRRLTPASGDWSQKDGAGRLYLFSLKALGVVRLRRGRVVQARRVLEALHRLDPVDEIGGGAFLQIARAFEEDDD